MGGWDKHSGTKTKGRISKERRVSRGSNFKMFETGREKGHNEGVNKMVSGDCSFQTLIKKKKKLQRQKERQQKTGLIFV